MEEALKYQHVFHVNKKNITTKKIKKRRSVSRLGCFRCKLRKIKCDENKPVCFNCSKNYLECNWPSLELQNKSKNSISERYSHLSSFISSQFVSNNICSDRYQLPLSLFSSSQYNNCFPGMKLSDQDANCYFAFVQDFLPSIAQCHIRENNPIACILPHLFNSSSIIREICFMCGSYTLGITNDYYKDISKTRYKKMITGERIYNVGKNLQVKSEQWIITHFLHLLCLKHKFGGFSGTYDTMNHFCTSLKEIYDFKAHFEPQVPNSPLIDRSISQNIIKGVQESKLDAIIFNYPVIILFCEYQHLGNLIPNPFDEIFIYELALSRTYGDTKECNIFRQNIISLQTAGQASWLFRSFFLRNNVDFSLINGLINLSYENINYLTNIFSLQWDTKDKASVLLAKLIYASSIVILKSIVTQIDSLDKEVENDLDQIVKIIEDPSMFNIVLPVWSLSIGAMASNSSEKKHYFKKKLRKMKDTMHIASIENLLTYLESIWEITDNGSALEKLLQLPTYNPLCV